jgi:hypothetical protein
MKRRPVALAAIKAVHTRVTDIFLPQWFAHNLPALHAPLLVLVAGIHLRNIRLNPPSGHGPE